MNQISIKIYLYVNDPFKAKYQYLTNNLRK